MTLCYGMLSLRGRRCFLLIYVSVVAVVVVVVVEVVVVVGHWCCWCYLTFFVCLLPCSLFCLLFYGWLLSLPGLFGLFGQSLIN